MTIHPARHAHAMESAHWSAFVTNSAQIGVINCILAADDRLRRDHPEYFDDAPVTQKREGDSYMTAPSDQLRERVAKAIRALQDDGRIAFVCESDAETIAGVAIAVVSDEQYHVLHAQIDHWRAEAERLRGRIEDRIAISDTMAEQRDHWRAESLEQACLLGMSGSREAKLLAQLEEMARERDAAEAQCADMQRLANDSCNQLDKAREVLRKLTAAVDGSWRAFEYELRPSISNTNYEVVAHWLREAEATLAALTPSPTTTEGTGV
jgi:hypothetical protein